MKITVWVLSTCIPERGEKPCLPQVFGSLTDAEAAADAALREEWTIHGLFDEETGDLLPYPGNWREAHNAIAESIGDGSWGEWELTSHSLDLGNLAVTLEGGMIQCIVTDGDVLKGALITTIDYDTEGGDEDALVEVEQGDGTFAEAYVDKRAIHKAEIVIP